MAAKVFRAAARASADIRIITTSEVQITLLVTQADFEAVQKRNFKGFGSIKVFADKR